MIEIKVGREASDQGVLIRVTGLSSFKLGRYVAEARVTRRDLDSARFPDELLFDVERNLVMQIMRQVQNDSTEAPRSVIVTATVAR